MFKWWRPKAKKTFATAGMWKCSLSEQGSAPEVDVHVSPQEAAPQPQQI
jgi:hypothetical protein